MNLNESAPVGVSKDADNGYLRLDPVPSPEYVEAWYRDQYYDLIAAGGRAPELRRMLAGGETAAEEIRWLKNSLWKDLIDVLSAQFGARVRLLDFGCGMGHFLDHCRDVTGWDVVGIEPAESAAAYAKQLGLRIYPTFQQCAAAERNPFDAIVSINVLEHVNEPVEYIRQLRSLSAPGSIIAIVVPNDFSELQESAQKALGVDPWWIAVPDHINYFNFSTLSRLLAAEGFTVFDQLTTFPMELFLLFGEQYASDPDVGAACHRKRVRFEAALPTDLRRSLYRALAQLGMGRQCIVFARRTGK